jgi:hypothetical protein
VAPVELLEQHHPRQLVRERDRPERESVVHLVELQAVRSTDHEAQVATALAPFLQKAAERHGVEHLAIVVQQGHECPIGEPSVRLLILTHLDQLEARVSSDQLLVVLDVVGERRPQSSYGDDDYPHAAILRAMEDRDTPERHINIHFSPEDMGGKYANFANVSHSDYEFTITFARVDHEVEEEEIPGVVVSRINLSPKFMRELIDAMQDNYSKWQTREGIKNLPEWGGQGQGEE